MEDVDKHRPLLFSLAYHILGEVNEAEDIVQDVFEAWFSKRPEVQYPKAYLSRAVVNRSIDRLEQLKKVRDAYKGVWLPVPVVSQSMSSPERLVDPLPYAMLSLLEKLNPVERAAFILRRAFNVDYSEISIICDVPEENARQLVHRAQEKLQKPQARFETSDKEKEKLLNAFLQAAATHNVETLKELLHQDVVMYADGGGKVAAVPLPLYGPDKIIAFLTNVLKDATDVFDIKPVFVNNSPAALISSKATGIVDTIFTIETDGSRITGLFFVRNPEKIVV